MERNELIFRINNLLFPRRCPVCDCILPCQNDRNMLICKECDKRVIRIEEPRCYLCGKQLEDEEKEFCEDCSRKRHFFDQGVAAFAYSDDIKLSMYRFKYSGRREYAGFYAAEIRKNLWPRIRTWQAQVLIPVPLHPSKLRKRGYNQAEVLARRIGDVLEIPVDTGILVRVRSTKPQKEVSDMVRRKNIENAFQIRPVVVKYKNVILVDDIYTSGTTIDECARTLKRAGAENVYFITSCIGKGF